MSSEEFFPKDVPIARYGNQFWRNQSNGSGGTVEFNTPGGSDYECENAQLYFEAGAPKNAEGLGSGGSDEITLIYKENHAEESEHRGKYNVKVKIGFNGARDREPARYTGEVELGAEDNHNQDTNPKKFMDVKYENTDVIEKYKPGDQPIRAKGSYQDTPDNGVRYKLEVQDPETMEWKKIFDHVDYGDKNHDIKNYRGKSAYCSAMRIDGSEASFLEMGEKKVKDTLRPLQFKPIDTEKSEKQQELLKALGYGRITFVKIAPDDGKWNDGNDDPISFGKKED